MHVFTVVREPYGWTVRLAAMSTPFRSRALALREAHRLCAGLRRHGEIAEVVIEDHHSAESPPSRLLHRGRAAIRDELFSDGRASERVGQL